MFKKSYKSELNAELSSIMQELKIYLKVSPIILGNLNFGERTLFSNRLNSLCDRAEFIKYLLKNLKAQKETISEAKAVAADGNKRSGKTKTGANDKHVSKGI